MSDKLNHDKDPLVDACLDEILGGVAPPDLTERILQAWQSRRQVESRPLETLTASSPASEARDVRLPASAESRAAVNGASRRRAGSTSGGARRWAAIATVAAVILLIWGLMRLPNSGPSPVAAPDGSRSPSGANLAEGAPASLGSDGLDDWVKRGGASGDTIIVPQSLDNAPRFAERGPEVIPELSQARRLPSPPPVSDPIVVAEINQQLAEVWRDKQLPTREVAKDSQWCRRAFLRLLGRIPTVLELEAFATSDSSQRRELLVQSLQESPEYRDEYVGHWAQYWTNVLIGRTGGGKSDPASRHGLAAYLSEALRERRPYDQMVFELLSATGASSPEQQEFNGAVNFIAAHWAPNGVQATAQTARVFQGKRMRCVQCHDHPVDGQSRQHDFWAMNAFFRQTQIQRKESAVFLVNVNFAGEGKQDWDAAEIYYELPDGRTRVAYPELRDAPPVSPSGRVAEVDRRRELALRIASSAELPQAAVNRLWEHFLGFGFTLPVNDMGAHNPPTHPALLDLLAGQFVAHDYDLDRVIRWIVLSDAFNRSSSVPTTNALADAPESGGLPWFSRYYARQLQQEAVYDSLALVAAARASGELDPGRNRWLAQFANRNDTDDGGEENSFRGDVRQALTLFNGELTRRAIDPNAKDGVLARVLRSEMKPAAKVEHLFLAAVARDPSKRELEKALEMIEEAGAAAALQDVWWALLNSSEFILDH